MSNHMIGYSMAPLIRYVMELREKKEISDNAAASLIKEMISTVGENDGNEYEATEEVNTSFCGNCGIHVPRGKPLFDLYDFLDEIDSYNERLIESYTRYGTFLCEDCFRKFIAKANKDFDIESEIKRQVEDGIINISR